MSVEETLFHASEISKYIHSLYTGDEYNVRSFWKGYYDSGPNPYYYQTETGIFIEDSIGDSPCYLWTPLGRWTILGSVNYGKQSDIKAIRQKLFKYVQVEEFRPVPTCKYPSRGAIWKVKGYNGITLPDAVPKSKDFVKYNDAKSQFDEFTKKYPSWLQHN